MSVLIKEPKRSDVDNRPPKSKIFVPNKYDVILWRPKFFDEKFMMRLIAKHFCQASSFQRYPHDIEKRNAYAQYQAREMVIEMCKKPFIVAATYPNRDIAETKMADIKKQEPIFQGSLPVRCIPVL